VSEARRKCQLNQELGRNYAYGKIFELKRTDFLTAIQSIKTTVRIKSAPARELQIGPVNGANRHRIIFC
jgi:hypothetical protein